MDLDENDFENNTETNTGSDSISIIGNTTKDETVDPEDIEKLPSSI